MKADITKEGMLEITPMSVTEETMLNIWIIDKEQKSRKVKEALIINLYEEIGPSCIKSISETAGEVENITGEMKKEVRKRIKAELDAMVEDPNDMLTEYNEKASTKVLEGILKKAKAADPNAKKATKTTPPKKEKSEKPAEPAAPPTEEPAAPSAEAVSLTLDEMKEVVKRYFAVFGAVAARTLLLEYKAEKVSAVKEEDYPALVKAMEVSEEEYQKAVAEKAKKDKEAADGE